MTISSHLPGDVSDACEEIRRFHQDQNNGRIFLHHCSATKWWIQDSYHVVWPQTCGVICCVIQVMFVKKLGRSLHNCRAILFKRAFNLK